MPYTIEQIIFSAFILLCGGILQSTVGFAYGLFAIPLLMWLELPLPQIIAAVLVSTFLQSFIAFYALRKEELERKQLVIASVIRVLFIVLGVVCLQIVVEVNKHLLHAIIGAILILSVIFLWLLPRK
ncbi:MAG: sulfite exporter TauE/SafE family protein, partial [Planctomycetes bacterium]|nr:sulfite exporter TauE/SafE family protein [Planctomycetota bacterium]